MIELILGDCLEKLKEIPENSIESVVTDPPYGLTATNKKGKKSQGGFMNQKWDYDVPSVETWQEILRILKPGGHLLSFGGSRTYHRMAVNVEDAGFEIRDQIMWIYGSGFPKGVNISRDIDKILGKTRSKKKIEFKNSTNTICFSGEKNPRQWVEQAKKDGFILIDENKSISDEAIKWDGWLTNLKPAHEPIILARKPLMENSVAENVLKWGTAGLNIDDCRVLHNFTSNNSNAHKKGRHPANVIHDGSDEVLNLFPVTRSGNNNYMKRSSKDLEGNTSSAYGAESRSYGSKMVSYGDKGSAARFFYCAKASPKEREKFNKHPTVKPIKLMEYLVKLITPINGTVLDPFMGSGSTGIAAKLNNFNFIGIENNKEYLEIAQKRIYQNNQGELF